MGENDSSESIDTSGRSDSSKTSDTEDDSSGDDDDGGQSATVLGTEERGVSGTPNSSSPSMNSIKAIRSVDVFDNSAYQGTLYKRTNVQGQEYIEASCRVVCLCREV